MTVSLNYDPASDAPSGISRLRRLASFGRYGADVHGAARTTCSTKPSGKDQRGKEDCSLLAASLSSFYGWLAKQTGSKAVLGHQASNHKHRLQAQKQVSRHAHSIIASPVTQAALSLLSPLQTVTSVLCLLTKPYMILMSLSIAD